MDIRKGGCNPIPISYLIQTANQFDCDIFVTNDNTTANLKRYDEMKRLNIRRPDDRASCLQLYGSYLCSFR